MLPLDTTTLQAAESQLETQKLRTNELERHTNELELAHQTVKREKESLDATLVTERQTFEAMLDMLQKQLEGDKADAATVAAEKDALAAEKDALEVLVKEKEANIVALNGKIDWFLQEMQSFEAKIAEQQTRIEDLLLDDKFSKDAIRAHDDLCDKNKTELAALTAEKAGLMAERDKLMSEVGGLAQQLERVSAENDAIKRAAAAENDAIKRAAAGAAEASSDARKVIWMALDVTNSLRAQLRPFADVGRGTSPMDALDDGDVLGGAAAAGAAAELQAATAMLSKLVGAFRGHLAMCGEEGRQAAVLMKDKLWVNVGTKCVKKVVFLYGFLMVFVVE